MKHYKHYILVEMLSNLYVKTPLRERKVHPHKRKVPTLTTFSRRFCLFVWIFFGLEIVHVSHMTRQS